MSTDEARYRKCCWRNAVASVIRRIDRRRCCCCLVSVGSCRQAHSTLKGGKASSLPVVTVVAKSFSRFLGRLCQSQTLKWRSPTGRLSISNAPSVFVGEYRVRMVDDDRWFEFCGVQSPGHGPHYSYTINNQKPDHPFLHVRQSLWHGLLPTHRR